MVVNDENADPIAHEYSRPVTEPYLYSGAGHPAIVESMRRRRRAQRDVEAGASPAADLDSVFERVVRVARATGAANAGILIPGARTVLVRAGIEPSPIPDTAPGRAFLAALARR